MPTRYGPGAKAASTLPGIPPWRPYPALTKIVPPATVGPAESSDPPIASTPFTAAKVLSMS